MNEAEQDERLRTTEFFIEATTYEKLTLWEKYHQKTHWEEDTCGFWIRIGCIDGDEDKPVCVSFFFAKLHGKRICFYEPTSRFVDTEMVENWIKEKYPIKYDNGTRSAMTNAMNFHHALHYCQS